MKQAQVLIYSAANDTEMFRLLSNTYSITVASSIEDFISLLHIRFNLWSAVVFDQAGLSSFSEKLFRDIPQNFPLIIIDDHPEREAKMLSLGAWDFICKPMHCDALQLLSLIHIFNIDGFFDKLNESGRSLPLSLLHYILMSL